MGRTLKVTAADLNIRLEDLCKLISSEESLAKLTTKELTDVCFALGCELQERGLKIENG